ncbi:hypothetical protein BBJ29_008188 [Phytophthora kernoviae]|uniref:Uncharacterized protein n=1 Tax=Phytophthora kernoviae TaxID=325452 RepID=A0A421G2U8_9STRA|nr:hypothetical protein BBJ29_008188 [Phytophthora kernoviae]
METKKLEYARRLQENESMTLEDFRSRKVEDLLASDMERQRRNQSAARQMGELEAERAEQARQKLQVELQAHRLEEQKAQREALKTFQRAFEQKELVSSPVEAYWLDAPAVYERFDDIASGARVLAADLAHFYEIKALQMRESAEKRLELEALQNGPLVAKELQVRNLERVQAKAQNTGMIAKAGMGTVRIVPIMPAEMQELGLELDAARDDLERMQNDAALQRKHLAWKDQLLQRLSMLIQRNERFREEIIAKLSMCADLGNERVLSQREDTEVLELKCDNLIKLREKLIRRQVAVEGECERARAADTAFFDTSLRVEGALQRVHRTVVIKELEEEAKTLIARITGLDEEEAAARHALDRGKATLEEVANQTFVVEESQRTLEHTTEVKNSAASSINNELSDGKKAGDQKSQPDQDVAETVRLKKHIDRSPEEKQWVGLDFLVNFAHYYKHVDPAEVEIIQKSTDYQQKNKKKLTGEQLQRLMQLPAHLLPRKQDELQNVFLTIQLSERKKRLARRLATEAKDQARVVELEMLRNTQKLERDNVEPLLSHEERRDLHATIHTENNTFTHTCFLFSKREEEARDIEQSLRELTTIHVNILGECESMEQQLAEYRDKLPHIAAILSGDPTAAKLARELNVEYVNKSGMKSSKVRWAELSAMKAKLPSMMTHAERLRRKYKKGRDILDKKEREWVLLDRILHPRLYQWEGDKHGSANDGGYTNAPGVKLRLHGAHPKLSKDEEQLAALSQMELERIMKAPWNLLERKEIQIRKIITRFRDDHGVDSERKANGSTMTVVALLRTQKSTDLTHEEREWRLYDQLLNPMYYPVNFKRLAKELAGVVITPGGLEEVLISPTISREDIVMSLNTPEEELYKLPSDLLRGRTLLLKYDPQLGKNLLDAIRIQHQSQDQTAKANVAEMDVDARCRIVFQELQRAIANTRNEFMDSYVLHSTLQRFPTKVLRLELEKDLDRLLISQIKEKEDFELANFLSKKKIPGNSVDAISDSDSDEEAKIAREVEERRKAKDGAKRGTKVWGKALKMKSLQKQRREIKDALQGRSLEQQRLILREQELGPGGCIACWTNPCQWKPFLEDSYTTIQDRIDIIREELDRVKHCPDLTISSSVCMAAVKSGNQAITLRKSDLFDELTLEVKIWEKNLRLKAVDEEFHETFRSKNEFFETQALHGFRQIQHKTKVQVALQREHNILVAHLTAYEVVEDILESMLEGWNFGERKSDRQVLGYVPSLKREGPLTMQDLRRFEQDRRILQIQQDIREEQMLNAQGLPSDKWKPIEVEAFHINLNKKAVQKGSELDKSLTETENALKFGLFCMTLMYFRGLSLLKKQKSVWSVSATKRRTAADPPKSAERRRMDKEKRNIDLRARKAALYDEKARNGQARKQKFQEQKLAAYRKRLVDENRKAKRERRAATDIQRIYRGHLGKSAGKKWMVRRREINAQRALDHAAAIMLQRAYRGRLGRIAAEDKRVELAEFISQIRAEEAIDEEEEYWNNHRVERIARKAAAFVKKEA